MSRLTLEDVNTLISDALKMNNMASLHQYEQDLLEIGTPEALAWRDRALGLIADSQGNTTAALDHLNRALSAFEQLDDRVGQASVAGNIGGTYLSMGQYADALTYSRRALELFEELGSSVSIASVLGSIGHIYGVTGQNSLALECFSRALDLNIEHGQQNGAASSRCNIGNIYKFTGDYPKALEYYHHAQKDFEQLGNQRFLANVLLNIGGAYSLLGEAQKALDFNQQALAVYEELEFLPGVATSLSNVGYLYSVLGDHEQAIANIERARPIFTSIQDARALGHLLSTQIGTLTALDRWSEAEIVFDELESMSLDEPLLVVLREFARATFAERNGDTDRVAEIYHSLLDYTREHDQPDRLVMVHQKLRDLALKRNDLASYVEHNNEYTRINELINGKETATRLAMQEAQRLIDEERKEHEKQLAVLHATLPKHIADRVASGESVNDELEHAAVLFADIVGFTTHSADLDAMDVTKLLGGIYRRFDEICKQYDVIKVKTIGDSYMCFTGDNSNEQNAAAVAEVALAMQQSRFQWPTPTPAESDTDERPIRFRIGIHIGPVTAGVIGAERLQYDVWGDTVNVASRMESTGEPGKIQVSEVFARSLTSFRDNVTLRHPERGEADEGPLFTERGEADEGPLLTERGTIDVKGKGTMTTYWLENSA